MIYKSSYIFFFCTLNAFGMFLHLENLHKNQDFWPVSVEIYNCDTSPEIFNYDMLQDVVRKCILVAIAFYFIYSNLFLSRSKLPQSTRTI